MISYLLFFATVTWPPGCQIKSTTCGNEIGTQPEANGARFLCARGGDMSKKGHFLPFFHNLDIIPGIFATVICLLVARLSPLLVGMKLGLNPGRTEHLFHAPEGGTCQKRPFFAIFS